MVTSSSAQARGWSASATVPATAPEATPERNRCCCSGVPTSRTMGANWVTVARSGPGGDGPAQLLDDDGRLEDGQADAAVLLGDGQGGPVEGDHGAPQLLGRLAGLDDGADGVDGTLLFEERADRGTQLFLLSRELELHRTPFPALPVASPTPCRAAGARRSGRVYLTPLSASVARATFTPPRFLGRTWAGCALGGSPVRGASPDRRRGGRARGSTSSPALPDDGVRSPTLSGAPLAQRQSNGLLIRRFRVRIPRGALCDVARHRRQLCQDIVDTALPRFHGIRW